MSTTPFDPVHSSERRRRRTIAVIVVSVLICVGLWWITDHPQGEQSALDRCRSQHKDQEELRFTSSPRLTHAATVTASDWGPGAIQTVTVDPIRGPIVVEGTRARDEGTSLMRIGEPLSDRRVASLIEQTHALWPRRLSHYTQSVGDSTPSGRVRLGGVQVDSIRSDPAWVAYRGYDLGTIHYFSVTCTDLGTQAHISDRVTLFSLATHEGLIACDQKPRGYLARKAARQCPTSKGGGR